MSYLFGLLHGVLEDSERVPRFFGHSYTYQLCNERLFVLLDVGNVITTTLDYDSMVITHPERMFSGFQNIVMRDILWGQHEKWDTIF